MNTMKTIEEIAEKLDGMEYGDDIDDNLLNYMAYNNIVVVTGYSDDVMFFSGAIRDEVECYNGGIAYILYNGLLKNNCDDDDCPYFERFKQAAKTIEAVWNKNGYSWTYQTNIPHASFDVMEDGDKFCRGIIFDLTQLEET